MYVSKLSQPEMIPVRLLFILASVAALSVAAPVLPLDDTQALLESLSAEFSTPKTLKDSNVDTAVVDVQTSVSDGPSQMTFKGYEYKVVSFGGTAGSENIMNACKAAGLVALCDHPNYVNHGYACLQVPGMNGHWSYEPHVSSIMGNSDLTAMMRYRYFYVGIQSHSQYSHYNTAGSHEGAGQNTGRNPNGGTTVCAKKITNQHDDHLLPVQALLEQLRQKLLATIASTDGDIATKEAKAKKTRRESDETIKLAEEAAAKVGAF